VTTVSLATKAMIPLDRQDSRGVGLLGSPCFEIPRSVDRDGRIRSSPDRDKLRAACRENCTTSGIGIFLFGPGGWASFWSRTGLAAFDLYAVCKCAYGVLTQRVSFNALSS